MNADKRHTTVRLMEMFPYGSGGCIPGADKHKITGEIAGRLHGSVQIPLLPSTAGTVNFPIALSIGQKPGSYIITIPSR